MTIEKPMLFSSAMVRALLDGSKTQTRRIFKGFTPPDGPGLHLCRLQKDDLYAWHLGGRLATHPGEWTKCPHPVGSLIWCKETWYDSRHESKRHPVTYRADTSVDEDLSRDFAWKPPIFMPRWASRITLEVTAVRVERLYSITDLDVLCEGVESKTQYIELWDKLNLKRGFGWNQNPWVWVYQFRKA